MPTEMANGHQVMKTCEAIIDSGIDLALFNGHRYQLQPSLRGVDPFEYYGIRDAFDIKRIPYIDTQPFANYIGPLIRPARIISSAMFPPVAELRLRLWKPTLTYTRQWFAARWLVARGMPTSFEMHEANTAHFSHRAVRTVAKLTHATNMKFVVTISHSLKDTLIDSGADENKIHVVPDAFDDANYHNSLSKPEIRTEIGLPVDKKIAVYTGGAAPGKGVEILFEAARKVEGVEIYVVGGQRHNIDRILKNSSLPSNVHLIPQVVPEMAAKYQIAADILLLPQQSLQSQSPLKLYEYIAAGRPIVATDLEPIREVLEHEHSALLAAPGSSDSYADEISRLKDDPVLGKKLTENATEEHGSWSWAQRGKRIGELARETA